MNITYALLIGWARYFASLKRSLAQTASRAARRKGTKTVMNQRCLEEKAAKIERQVARVQAGIQYDQRRKAWRRTVGMSTGDEGMCLICRTMLAMLRWCLPSSP